MFGRERGKRATMRLQALSHCRFTSRLTLCVCEHMKWLRVRGRQLRLQSGTNPSEDLTQRKEIENYYDVAWLHVSLGWIDNTFKNPLPLFLFRHDKERTAPNEGNIQEQRFSSKQHQFFLYCRHKQGCNFSIQKPPAMRFISSTTNFQYEHLPTEKAGK